MRFVCVYVKIATAIGIGGSDGSQCGQRSTLSKRVDMRRSDIKPTSAMRWCCSIVLGMDSREGDIWCGCLFTSS